MIDPDIKSEVLALVEKLHNSPHDANAFTSLKEELKDVKTMDDMGDDLIPEILAIKEKAGAEGYEAWTLLEAEVRLWHEGPQIGWEVLVGGIAKHPDNGQMLAEIENLNDSDAPVFADGMETLGGLVAEGKFPRDLFDYLCVALEDEEYPEQFELAIQNANEPASS